MTQAIDDSHSGQATRNIAIRVIAAVFWLLVTMLVVNMIVGGVVGAMAGAEAGAGQSIENAADAGARAGEQAAVEFMSNHGGKVLLFEIALWAGLVFTGKYPWVSKHK